MFMLSSSAARRFLIGGGQVLHWFAFSPRASLEPGAARAPYSSSAHFASRFAHGLACFAAVADVGCAHAAIKTGAGQREQAIERRRADGRRLHRRRSSGSARTRGQGARRRSWRRSPQRTTENPIRSSSVKTRASGASAVAASLRIATRLNALTGAVAKAYPAEADGTVLRPSRDCSSSRRADQGRSRADARGPWFRGVRGRLRKTGRAQAISKA